MMSSANSASALPPGVEAIPTEKLDLRPESEILSTLLTYRTVTSEKNIWTFWNDGWDNMKPWTQRNVIAWLRRFELSGWTVRVLDLVPDSPNHVSKFLNMDEFPEAFKANSSAVMMPQATADFFRIALLYEHGGVWLDVSCMVFCDLDDIWAVIQDPETEYTTCGYITKTPSKEFYMFGNSALFSQKRDAFMKRWRDAFAALWQGRTSAIGIHRDLLISWLEPYTPTPPYPSGEATKSLLNDYIAVNLVVERLLRIRDPLDGFDGPAYWSNKIFKLDLMADHGYAQITTNLDGQKLFDLFASQRGGIKPGERNQEAETLANYMCTNTTIAKFFSGFGAMNRDGWLPGLWNRPENANADIKEGSFIAWLRYAQVHLRLTRMVVPIVTEAIPIENVVKMGACERKEVKSV